ncbi:MAG: hypothetical protein L3J56_13800, partial [Bacteroidales bacterium]|nr:hypothetical protein [Bacteroidales bacterium]
KIFFNRENYLYFLRKIKTHITPYADILAWCLMPNHFHLMVLVREVEIDTMTLSHRINPRSLNNSIAIMLRSYTRAINKEQKLSGALFRPHSKAECVTCPGEELTPSFVIRNGITEISWQDYPNVCFHYIHQNPVKVGLVEQASDWEYSSARDYAELRQGKLVNKKLVKVFDIEI